MTVEGSPQAATDPTERLSQYTRSLLIGGTVLGVLSIAALAVVTDEIDRRYTVLVIATNATMLALTLLAGAGLAWHIKHYLGKHHEIILAKLDETVQVQDITSMAQLEGEPARRAWVRPIRQQQGD